jgi:hypothetical protein
VELEFGRRDVSDSPLIKSAVEVTSSAVKVRGDLADKTSGGFRAASQSDWVDCVSTVLAQAITARVEDFNRVSYFGSLLEKR